MSVHDDLRLFSGSGFRLHKTEDKISLYIGIPTNEDDILYTWALPR